jgi:hypothetical protein
MPPSPPFAQVDVLAEGDFQEGIRWLVLRGPFESPVAYIGIPLDSPAAGLNTGCLDQALLPHGGWTFAGAGDGTYRPQGWWWWGWDYAHSSDWTPVWPHGHRWTTEEVVAEIRELLPEFEAWLRSRPEDAATPDDRRGPPTVAELRAMAESLLGEGCVDVS